MSAIRLDVLVRAVTALRLAKGSPVDKPMPKETWAEVMRSHSELEHHVDQMLRDQQVEVAIDRTAAIAESMGVRLPQGSADDQGMYLRGAT